MTDDFEKADRLTVVTRDYLRRAAQNIVDDHVDHDITINAANVRRAAQMVLDDYHGRGRGNQHACPECGDAADVVECEQCAVENGYTTEDRMGDDWR